MRADSSSIRESARQEHRCQAPASRILLLSTAQHLVEVGGQLASVASDAAAATGVSAGVLADLRTWLGAGGAVEELVTSEAGHDAALALEHAATEIRCADTVGNAHGATAHVDLARHIEGGPLAVEGIFTPGLGDLAPLRHLGVSVDRSPRARCAVGEGDSLDSASWNGDCDQRLDGIDPGASGAPDDEDELLTG
jgi:hypothetical protein